jgi:uncharacterized phiE125 gp8 family phage protein
MSVTTVTPGAAAVDLPLAKAHLNITSGHEDPYLTSLIETAQQHLENSLDRALTNTVLEERVTAHHPGGVLRLRPRVQSVAEIKGAGADQVVAPASYALSGENGVRLAYGAVWPGADLTVRYTAGFGATPAAVPAPIRHAILLHLGDLYAFRETAIVGSISGEIAVSATVENLIAPYRHWRA